MNTLDSFHIITTIICISDVKMSINNSKLVDINCFCEFLEQPGYMIYVLRYVLPCGMINYKK